MTEWIYPNLNHSYRVGESLKGLYPEESLHEQTSPSGILLPPKMPIAPIYTYDNSSDYERDMKYLQQLYPNLVTPMLAKIQETCDRMDRPRCFFYDQYPDKEQLLMLVQEIYDALASEEQAAEPDEDTAYPMETPANTVPSFTAYPRNPWLLCLIQTLLSNEILYRRQKNHTRPRYQNGYDFPLPNSGVASTRK